MANVVVATSERVYRLRLTSTSSTRPTYAEFTYAAPVVAHKTIAKPTPAPGPLAQMDAACAAMPENERYGTDPQPAQWRPVRVCHNASRTFIQLPYSATVPTDVPQVLVVTASGDETVIAPYDPASRIYGVDLVPDALVLMLGHGKHAMRMRVQRQFVSPTSVAVRPMPSPASVTGARPRAR
jgi:type IV secretory pathway VirB9-like protein